MIEIKKAGNLGEYTKRRISEIFVEGFGKHLTFFSKDSHKLVDAFEHMFVIDLFFVAVVDEVIAGITACSNGISSCINLDRKELRKHLGFYKGTMAYFILKHEFEKPAIVTGDGLASVEFVATAEKFRKKGVALALINHLFSLPQYSEYVLEVADTNINAVKLYNKLGFKEFKRIKQKYSKISGVNYLVYMKYVKS
ncbi:GNAT family N-acetyltransferase [Mobilitalea sibirica]|uniref:GNAT family N-acetyltransferase n=1 Tax=Mobilitalea sibirica TaxID=1462919 RepID=A0A8J7H8W7_9FIRM|nr:GNAT family N-acetyltransferase [Mobilitalea sibirica]MBH1940595.1 GNAT family N-acetyltransferase [Mobilitalea sibirica]